MSSRYLPVERGGSRCGAEAISSPRVRGRSSNGPRTVAGTHDRAARATPTVRGRDYSAFGPELVERLDRAGVLTYEMRRATGAWSYNDKVSYWALMPRPPVGAVLTWAAYCEQIGRSADWTYEDKAVVAAMAANAKPAH